MKRASLAFTTLCKNLSARRGGNLKNEFENCLQVVLEVHADRVHIWHSVHILFRVPKLDFI
jgi:hypothetical protein